MMMRYSFELEEEAEKEHRALGELISQKDFTEVYLVGKLITAAQTTFPKARHFYTRDELNSFLKQNPIENATVLVKASRGIGLEVVVENL